MAPDPVDNASLNDKQTPCASQQLKRPFVLAGKRRFKLPWLDGNVVSGQTPESFDVENALPGHFPHQEDQNTIGHAGMHSSANSRASLAYYPATSAVSLPQSSRPRSRQHTRSWSSPLADTSTSMWDPTMPGGWPLVNGQLQYTPSSYSSQPPSETGLPLHLSRKSPHSYEDLIEENSVYPPKTPTWPLVPLSDTDFPTRMSSLTFQEPARQDSTLRSSRSAYELSRGSSMSSIGRYNDGTISRKPTVRASSMQARLDRAATAQLRSPDVSPRSSAPPRPAPGTTRRIAANNEQLSLQRAVTGLQDLMQEALTVATEAAKANQTHEVAQILSEATLALRSANTIQGRMPKPLQLDDPELGRRSSTDDYASDSDDYIESETSSVDRGSHETVPTNYTKSRSALSMRPDTAVPKLAEEEIGTGGVPRSSVPAVENYYPENARRATVNAPFRENGKRPTAYRATLDSARADRRGRSSSDELSIGMTPPAMYHQASADSVVTDWAYVKRLPGRRDLRNGPAERRSVRSSVEEPADVVAPAPIRVPTQDQSNFLSRSSPPRIQGTSEPSAATALDLPEIPRRRTTRQVPQPTTRELRDPSPSQPLSGRDYQPISHHQVPGRHAPHLSHLFESSYYKLPDKERDVHQGPETRYGLSTAVTSPNMSLRHPRRSHISLSENQPFRMHRYRRQPIAREWSTRRKRLTAAIACLNTALVGLIAGIYAGEVPKIQYQLADVNHRVILGNVVFYLGLGLSTMLAWPLPLLHGRKPYILAALAVALPLNFPQAIVVGSDRSPAARYYVGLLLPRGFMGLALGFANVNFLTTLFDMFGASLQSSNPHQEIVVLDDVRRQGGGMGLWLGIWSWCLVGTLSVGFLIGADITASLNPAWGFYIVVIIIAIFMLLNVIAPEPRRAPYRRSVLRYLDEDEKIKKRVARGEVKLHISMDGPKYWWEEMFAGLQLMGSMMLQPGFFVLSVYLAWIYALVVLVTLLLGALLSRDYKWRPQYIGLAVFAVAVGAALAVPLTKANLFSRDRAQPPRTDSMTFQPRITWTSHLLRRCIFTFALPVAGVGYALASPGPSVSWVGPMVLSAFIGFLSCLAVAECIGLIMETFDTSDLQPGINSKHRLQSMESATRRRRTNYSSYPRVTAGFFLAQTIGFFLSAVMTAISGTVTRAIGAQAATAVVVGALLILTILLSAVLWRFRTIQVIPNHALGTARSSHDWQVREAEHDPYFKPVIVGNPSGKVRRMNLLETGAWSRWTEIRKLNKLIKHKK